MTDERAMGDAGSGDPLGASRDGAASTDTHGTMTSPHDLQPLHVPTRRIILWGQACWALALAATLIVPALHTGDRSWWPWTCVTGLVLGGVAYLYVARGRGNAATAE